MCFAQTSASDFSKDQLFRLQNQSVSEIGVYLKGLGWSVERNQTKKYFDYNNNISMCQTKNHQLLKINKTNKNE